MNIIDIPSAPARRGPVADGPTVRPLLVRTAAPRSLSCT